MRRFYKNFSLLLMALIMSCADDSGDGVTLGSGDGVSGVGGSTARFAIRGNYMYVSTNSHLKVLDVTNARQPEFVNSNTTFGGLETAYIYDQYLFLGANDGVYIYDLIDPVHPGYLTRYIHQTGCDPVIAKEDFAYLTIRDGASCSGRAVNQLLTLDISDILHPVTVDTIEMFRPRGLTFYDGWLYVGEGIYGTKRFDISTPYSPQLDTFFTQIPANDMIGLSNQMIVTADKGVTQYQAQGDSLLLLSTID